MGLSHHSCPFTLDLSWLGNSSLNGTLGLIEQGCPARALSSETGLALYPHPSLYRIHHPLTSWSGTTGSFQRGQSQDGCKLSEQALRGILETTER